MAVPGGGSHMEPLRSLFKLTGLSRNLPVCTSLNLAVKGDTNSGDDTGFMTVCILQLIYKVYLVLHVHYVSISASILNSCHPYLKISLK